MNYVVYLTRYSGNKLPPFYIGSTSVEKILMGYNGTICSKKWKNLYDLEQKTNKHLFKTRVLSYHKTRKDALAEELRLQKMHRVRNNPRYFNEAYACIDGFFGRDVSGKNHPMYGKQHSEVTKKLWSEQRKGAVVSKETRAKISIANKGRPGKPHSVETREKLRQAHLGRKASAETRRKMSKSALGKPASEKAKKRMSTATTGKDNSQFTGYCIYKNKQYISTDLAKKLGLSTYTINNMCKFHNNKPIASQSYVLNPYLQKNYKKEEVVGKTWKDLGFSFITKEKFDG